MLLCLSGLALLLRGLTFCLAALSFSQPLRLVLRRAFRRRTPRTRPFAPAGERRQLLPGVLSLQVRLAFGCVACIARCHAFCTLAARVESAAARAKAWFELAAEKAMESMAGGAAQKYSQLAMEIIGDGD